jgi:hypothetical protein
LMGISFPFSSTSGVILKAASSPTMENHIEKWAKWFPGHRLYQKNINPPTFGRLRRKRYECRTCLLPKPNTKFSGSTFLKTLGSISLKRSGLNLCASLYIRSS